MNREAASKGEPTTVAGWLDYWAAEQPDAVFLGELTAAAPMMTYLDVARTVRQRAVALIQLGYGGGARLAFAPENTMDSAVWLLAINYCGACAVLLDPNAADARKADFQQRSGATPFRDIRDSAEQICGQLPPVSAQEVSYRNPDDEAFIVFTSGSTGRSQGVRLSDRNLLSNASDLRDHHSLSPSSRLATCLPLLHVNALGFSLVTSLTAGGRVGFTPAFEPNSFLHGCDEFGSEIINVVPSVLVVLCKVRSAPPPLDKLRYFLSAAGPLHASTAAACRTTFGKRVVQGYGMSEATNFSCTLPPSLSDAAYARLMLDDVPTVGVPLPGNEVRIVAAGVAGTNGSDIGEVEVRGDNVMLGYMDDEQATEAVITDGWLRTGDLGFFRHDAEVDGRLLVLTGRSKHVAKISGQSLGLEEVESLVLYDERVHGVIAVRLADPITGEAIGLCLATDGSVAEHEIRDMVADYFGASFRPRDVLFVDTVPLLASGKISRTAAAELFSNPTTSEVPT